jgi:hypothetical protein
VQWLCGTSCRRVCTLQLQNEFFVAVNVVDMVQFSVQRLSQRHILQDISCKENVHIRTLLPFEHVAHTTQTMGNTFFSFFLSFFPSLSLFKKGRISKDKKPK